MTVQVTLHARIPYCAWERQATESLRRVAYAARLLDHPSTAPRIACATADTPIAPAAVPTAANIAPTGRVDVRIGCCVDRPDHGERDDLRNRSSREIADPAMPRPTTTVLPELPPAPSPNAQAVGRAQLAHAEALAAQLTSGNVQFTPDPNADSFIRDDPFSFLLQ